MDRHPEAERRRHPRTQITWPVVVRNGPQVFHTHTLNLSARGAKVTATKSLALGTLVWLRFHPPGEPPLDPMAIAWRLDPDGLAFFFLEELAEQRFTTSDA